MKFKTVAEEFEKIETASGRIEMTRMMADLLKDAGEDIRTISYYLVGQVYPLYSQKNIGLGDRMIMSSLAEASEKSEENVRKMLQDSGDLGTVAEKIDIGNEKGLRVKEVDKALKKIAEASGEGSEKTKKNTLANVLKKASPKERKYITRLTKGTMRLGAGDKTVLDALSLAYLSRKKREPLEHAYNMCSDIGHVAETLRKSGLEGVKKIRIAINRPLRPMLAQRISKLSEIPEKIRQIAVEEKYDGERIQAHKSGNKVQLFSRRLTNITSQFPDVVEQVKQNIKGDAVIDGEVVAYNNKENTYYSFQKLTHRRRKYNVEEYAEKIPVKYMVFDLIYLDGKSLLKQPLKKRWKKLKRIIKETDNIALTGRVITNKVDEIEDFFNDCIERELEGVVCKGRESRYEAGARGWSWIKWKKEYAEELSDTFDLTVVGAYAGKGKRAGLYGSLLCATYNKNKDIFETATKLGAGFSDTELENLPEKLESFKTEKKPARVVTTGDIEPDFWVEPGIVLEVVASEITQSPVHTCSQNGKGLALRFPRFKRWRDDKSPEQSTTSKAVREMYEK